MQYLMLIAGLLTSSNVDLAQAATHFGPPSNYYAFTCKLEGQVLLAPCLLAILDVAQDMSAHLNMSISCRLLQPLHRRHA